MSAKNMYVRVRGKVLGPFSHAQLSSLRDRGQFHSFHEVSEDRVAWRPASTLAGMFESKKPDTSPTSDRRNDNLRAATVVEKAREHPAEWFFADRDGTEQGPITSAQLTRLMDTGAINSKTQVWREGMDDWLPLGQTAFGKSASTAQSHTADNAAALPPVAHFLANPVAGLPRIASDLSPGNALSLTLVFYLAAVSLVILSIVLAEFIHKAQVFSFFQHIANAPDRFEIIAKLVLLAVLPLVCLWLSVTLLRLITRSWGTFIGDGVIASAVLFSMSLFAPLLVSAWGVSFELVLFLIYLSGTLSILQLYAAFSKTLRLPDQGCIFAIPGALFLNFWLQTVMVRFLFRIEQPWWRW